MTSTDIIDFFLKLEGPYRWYALTLIAVVITGFVTHFIFKTLKWFFIIAAFGFIVFYLWSRIFINFNNTWWSNPAQDEKRIQENRAALDFFKATPTP